MDYGMFITCTDSNSGSDDNLIIGIVSHFLKPNQIPFPVLSNVLVLTHLLFPPIIMN